MNRKENLIEVRSKIYQQLRSFIAGLSDEERAAVGTPDDWSIKDAMIHVAKWDERRGINLAEIAKGQLVTDHGDYNEVNAREFEEHRNDTWEQVDALIERSQDLLMVGLEGVDDEQLSRTDLLPGEGERQAWNRIAGSCVIHPLLHMTEYLVRHDQPEQALEWMLEYSEQVANLDDGDQWQGTVMYNKACYYALAGYKEKAIDLLGRALPLTPGLVEWSKEDPDLDSLREEPGYLALY